MKPIPDVLKAAAKAYKLLLEKSRLLKLRLKPGEKEPMHNHPSRHVVYVGRSLETATLRLMLWV